MLLQVFYYSYVITGNFLQVCYFRYSWPDRGIHLVCFRTDYNGNPGEHKFFFCLGTPIYMYYTIYIFST